MSELLKNQKFGVEVEFTGITRAMAAEAVRSIVGGSITGPQNDAYFTRNIIDALGRKWKVMRDSSISPIKKTGYEDRDEYKVEFVTPPLHYSDIETLQTIIRKFKEIGGVPHSSCGIHIHIDGANHTADSLRRMVSFMYSRQDIIYEAMGVEDRKYSWCKPICQELNNAIKIVSTPPKTILREFGIVLQTMIIATASTTNIIIRRGTTHSTSIAFSQKVRSSLDYSTVRYTQER